MRILAPRSWPVAQGHAPWVEEIWVNYMRNGLRYGGRPPQLRLGATVQGSGTIRFWMQDNGPEPVSGRQKPLAAGLTRIERIQADGRGLGLWVVKRIAGALGGDVGLESQMGVGNTFYFTLPAVTMH